MMHTVWRFISTPAHWIHTRWERSVLNWAKSLYTWVLVIYSGWLVWWVISITPLYLRPDDSTLIQLDLLQAMAFLAAWSALLITVTAKIVNKSRDIDLGIAQLSWKNDAHIAEDEHIKNQVGAVEGKLEILKAEAERGLKLNTELQSKADILTDKNERLRRKMEDAGIQG